MAKRLTLNQKEQLVKSFREGKTIEVLSKQFCCTTVTIIRNLKKNLGETVYKKLIDKKKKPSELNLSDNKNKKVVINELLLNSNRNDSLKNNIQPEDQYDNNFQKTDFIEIAPLNFSIENTSRIELSSVPIEEIEFPNIVYMVVNKNIELEIKLLKDYPNWEFLPNEDLQRKTIEIYLDLKTAKRVCSKEQKVIKVPNTDVFRIVSPILISRGISRIVYSEKLIAL